MFVVVLPTFASAEGGSSLPLFRDTETETLLQDYARPVLKAAGLGVGRFTVGIVRDNAANVFTSDRRIFVSSGLLRQCETPNQIIGMIAHEIGHIVGGHADARQRQRAREQTEELIREITGSAKSSNHDDSELIVRPLASERRSQESAADQAGLQYLNATEQSGRGMLETLERFAQQEYISDSHKDAFVRSHPGASDRLARLRELVENSPHYAKKDSPELQLRHDLMRAKLSGYLENHRTVIRRYPESDTSIPARYARAIARYFMGDKNDVDVAVEEVNTLINEQPANPYFWELKGGLLIRADKAKDAIQPLRKALELMADAPLIQVQLAAALQKTGDAGALDESVRLLRKAVVHDTNPSAHHVIAHSHVSDNLSGLRHRDMVNIP
jgi:predicted Zn-dependent protease